MVIRESALSLPGVSSGEEAALETVPMDEEAFRAFYDSTARALWAYLSRATGNAAAADDLLQESYFRLLKAAVPEMSTEQRRKYLFRIATNLLRDRWRRGKHEALLVDCPKTVTVAAATEDEGVQAALNLLKPRERQLLWLAYVEEYDHHEIAQITGLKHGSIRMLLFRARHRLAALLREKGVAVIEAIEVSQ